MIYPAAVVTVAVVIIVVIMIFVVPAFKQMFDDIGKELPLPTQVLMSISNVLSDWRYMLAVAGTVGLLWLGFWWIGRTEKGRRALDLFKLRMPVFGNIMKKSSVARFCRTLGTLIASGVPILEALRIVKDAIPNVVIQRAIEDVHGSIREGDTIADPLRQSGIFDELLINMIDVGEETGELDKMLMKIADNYEADVDVAVEGMSSLLEPLLIVGMGLAVGFIVVALFLPLVSIIQGIYSSEETAEKRWEARGPATHRRPSGFCIRGIPRGIRTRRAWSRGGQAGKVRAAAWQRCASLA